MSTPAHLWLEDENGSPVEKLLSHIRAEQINPGLPTMHTSI